MPAIKFLPAFVFSIDDYRISFHLLLSVISNLNLPTYYYYIREVIKPTVTF